MVSPITIFSLNIGLNNSLAGLSSILQCEQIDVIFLQEVRLPGPRIEFLLPGYSAVSNIDIENPDRPGTAIAWHHTIPLQDVLSLKLCRIQMASLGPYRLVNIYGPSGSDKKQERSLFYGRDLFNVIQLVPNNPVICGGDFNCLLQSIDVEGGFGFNQKYCESLKTLVRVSKFTDVFRVMHATKEEFTFFRPGCSASRLDRFYVPDSLQMNIVDVRHIPSLSDHCGVKLKMKLDCVKLHGTKRSTQSYWKLNTAILNEEDFLPSFKVVWNNILQMSPLSTDIADWWDNVAKPSIKRFCIQFSIQRKKRRTAYKQFLLSSLKIFLENNNWEQVARTKECLNQILNEDLMGFIVRS